MQVFLPAFVLLLLAVLGMAVGVIVKGKRLSGSCGGRDKDGNLIADCLCEQTGKPKSCAFPPEPASAG